MAEMSGSVAGQREATFSGDASGAMELGGNTHWAEEADDDSDWEYEYSTTETDTYYLTVELSLPEFKSASTSNPHHSRGGYYKTWLQTPREAIERASAPARGQQPNQPASQDEVEEEQQPEPEPTAVDDDMENIDPMLRAPVMPDEGRERPKHGKRKKEETHKKETIRRARDGSEQEEESEGEEAQVSTEDIQILDLHSKRPIFSYRGRIFEGQWAENVGSEMILTDHDNESAGTLPVLRNLAGGVDLLATSASRIITKEKVLNPKVQGENTLDPIRKEWNINIPKGAYKMSERARQGNFLEKLMALKIKKGDKDHVTVYAKRPDGKEVDDGGDELGKRGKDKTSEGDQYGQGPPKRRRGSRGRRGPRSRPNGAGMLHDRDDEYDREPLSVPTPQSWADLGPSGRKTVAFEEEDIEDENDSEDIVSEDEEGEEGDTEDDDDEDQDENDEEDEDEDDEDNSEDEMDEEEDDDEATPGIQSTTPMDVD